MVGFDFDDTLIRSTRSLNPFSWIPIRDTTEKLVKEAKYHKIVIVTKRSNRHKLLIWIYLKLYKLPVEKIYCTDNKEKTDTLTRIGVFRFYDDIDLTEELTKYNIQFIHIKEI